MQQIVPCKRKRRVREQRVRRRLAWARPVRARPPGHPAARPRAPAWTRRHERRPERETVHNRIIIVNSNNVVAMLGEDGSRAAATAPAPAPAPAPAA